MMTPDWEQKSAKELREMLLNDVLRFNERDEVSIGSEKKDPVKFWSEHPAKLNVAVPTYVIVLPVQTYQDLLDALEKSE
jgi:hypothetical protein